MEKDPVILRTLTTEEKESIPPQILQKIQIEIKNQHNVHQTAISALQRKLSETDTFLISTRSQVRDFEKKINQSHYEKHMCQVECAILRSKIESLERENVFLIKRLKKIKTKPSDLKKEFEDKKKEIEGLIDSIVDIDKSHLLSEYEKTNRRLKNKVNDLKKQLTYLLESNQGGRSQDEQTQQKQELIRIIQTLSKENDRLNEMKSNDMEIERIKAQLDEKNRLIEDLETRLVRNEQEGRNLYLEEYQKFIDEIRVLSNEKNNLYEQYMRLYNTNLVLENKIRELDEDNRSKLVEIETLKSKHESFNQIYEKYNEVNNELIRSNVVVRQYRLKIVDLTKKLEESEERYSRYILSNRTDVVAILGRELEYMRKKIHVVADDFNELASCYEEFIKEQDKLTEMYRERCNELEHHCLKLSEMEQKQITINDMVNVIPVELNSAFNELFEALNSTFQDVFLLFDCTEKIHADYEEALFVLRNDVQDKENIIKSLIENNRDVLDTLVKHENSMLRNEIVLLNAKLDNLQSDEYADVIEKLEHIRTENENLREYIGNLSTEILNKENTIRSLEDNLLELREKLANKETLISKYVKIIEKLRKIKDEYVKLKKGRISEPNVSSEPSVPLEGVSSLEPHSTQDDSPSKNALEEKPICLKGRKIPILSTENFVVSEPSLEKPTKRKEK